MSDSFVPFRPDPTPWRFSEATLEGYRQTALVMALGQVECSKIYRHRDDEPCPDCGAKV